MQQYRPRNPSEKHRQKTDYSKLVPEERNRLLKEHLREGDRLFEREEFTEANFHYWQAVCCWNLPLEVIRKRDFNVINQRIPEAERKAAAKAFGSLAVAYHFRSHDRGKTQGDRRAMHEDAVAFLHCAMELDPKNDWNLLNLGMVCTPEDATLLKYDNVVGDAALGGRAFQQVLENHSLTAGHLSGHKPLSELQIRDEGARHVFWALNDLGLLRLVQGIARNRTSRGESQQYVGQAENCFKTILDAYSLPRNVRKIEGIDVQTFKKLSRTRQNTLIIALDRLAQASIESKDPQEAYHALSLSLSLKPDNEKALRLLDRVDELDPTLDAKPVQTAGEGVFKPAVIWREEVEKPREAAKLEAGRKPVETPGKPGQELPKPKPVKIPQEKPLEEKPKPKTWRDYSLESSRLSPPQVLKELGLSQVSMVHEWQEVKLPKDIETPYRDESKILLRELRALKEGGPNIAGGFLMEYKARARRWHDTPVNRENLCQFLCEKNLLEAVSDRAYMMAGSGEEALDIALSYVGKAEEIPEGLQPQAEVVEASYKRILGQALEAINKPPG